VSGKAWTLRSAAGSRRSPDHETNEDAWHRWEAADKGQEMAREGLYVVCDGVSSAGMGHLASRISTKRLRQLCEPGALTGFDKLSEMISELDWELRGMTSRAACTISLLAIQGSRGQVLTVGDSPVYRIRRGAIEQLGGRTNPADGRRLGAYLGMGPEISEVLQSWNGPLIPGDVMLLTTDGVGGLLPESELLESWTRTNDPTACMGDLMERVVHAGGRDDATVVVVEVLPARPGMRTFSPQDAPDPPGHLVDPDPSMQFIPFKPDPLPNDPSSDSED
jgi:serine/threonine protein phosphatase PrpC